MRSTKRGPGRPRAGETPVPVVKHLEHLEALQKAFGLAALNPPAGHEMPEGWNEVVPREVATAQIYRDWLQADPATRGDEPDIPEVDKRAARLSVGRAPGGQGRRPSIA